MQVTEARLTNLLKRLGVNPKLRGYHLLEVLTTIVNGNVNYNQQLRAEEALRLCKKLIEESFLDLTDILEEIEES